jgi:hypothetical protein
VHGGIGPAITSVADIEACQRPISSFCHNDVITDLVWADPVANIVGFMESRRGTGNVFGETELKNFLKKNKLTRLIRAHQCVQEGIEKFDDGRCLTIFSSSNYEARGNFGCFVHVSVNGLVSPEKLAPGPFVHRENAVFADAGVHERKTVWKSLSMPRGMQLAAVSSSRPCNVPSLRSNSFRQMSGLGDLAGERKGGITPAVTQRTLKLLSLPKLPMRKTTSEV